MIAMKYTRKEIKIGDFVTTDYLSVPLKHKNNTFYEIVGTDGDDHFIIDVTKSGFGWRPNVRDKYKYSSKFNRYGKLCYHINIGSITNVSNKKIDLYEIY